MAAGLSNWWATPAAVDRHFSQDELRRSEEYHLRLRRVGLGASAAQIVLLFAAARLAASVSGRIGDGFHERWHLDRGWVGGLFSTRVVLGVGLTVLALRVPAIVADAWFEFRFRRGRPDYRPVPVSGFVATVSALTITLFVALTVAAGIGYRLVAVRDDWVMIFSALALAVLSLAAIWERWLRQLLPTGETLLEPGSVLAEELDSVALRFGLDGLQFGTVPTGVRGDAGAERGPNAYSAGVGSNRRIVMNEALLDQDRRVRDFVVAHELTHLRRHHVLLQMVAGATAWALVTALLAMANDAGFPWTFLGLDPLDPTGLPAVVLLTGATLLLLSPVVSWLSRGHERVADTGAVEAMGPLPAALARQLYVATTVDLDPPLWARLYASHPSPAERLELLARDPSNPDRIVTIRGLGHKYQHPEG